MVLVVTELTEQQLYTDMRESKQAEKKIRWESRACVCKDVYSGLCV